MGEIQTIREELKRMQREALKACLLNWTGGILTAIAAGLLGFTAGQREEQQKAVSADVATYEVNPKTGYPEFVYKEVKP